MRVNEDELIRILFDEAQNNKEFYSAITEKKWEKISLYCAPGLADEMRGVDRAYNLLVNDYGYYLPSIPAYGIYHSTAIINPLNASGSPQGHPSCKLIKSSNSRRTYHISYSHPEGHMSSNISLIVDLIIWDNRWVLENVTYDPSKSVSVGKYGLLSINNAKEMLFYHELTLKDAIDYARKNPGELKTPEEINSVRLKN